MSLKTSQANGVMALSHGEVNCSDDKDGCCCVMIGNSPTSATSSFTDTDLHHSPSTDHVSNASSSSLSSSGGFRNSQNNTSNNSCYDIYFRPICPEDRFRIQQLHEEWFPVIYQDEFYDDLVESNLAGHPLYTSVAISKRDRRRRQTDNLHDDEETGGCTTALSLAYGDGTVASPPPQTTPCDGESDDEIAGCVVGSFVAASSISKTVRSLLLSDPTRHSRLFYIMTLGTVEEYRNVGLGSALVQECLEQVEQDPDCGTCYLHVITHNQAALRFYEKLGFYRVSKIDNYYDINGVKHACYLYARYFHGNRGHRDLFKMMSRAFWSVWRQVSSAVLANTTLGETIGISATATSSLEDEIMEP